MVYDLSFEVKAKFALQDFLDYNRSYYRSKLLTDQNGREKWTDIKQRYASLLSDEFFLDNLTVDCKDYIIDVSHYLLPPRVEVDDDFDDYLVLLWLKQVKKYPEFIHKCRRLTFNLQQGTVKITLRSIFSRNSEGKFDINFQKIADNVKRVKELFPEAEVYSRLKYL